MKELKACINGFGRFGLGLFRSWYEDPNSSYKISYINDDVLSIEEIIKILKNDPLITSFNDMQISRNKNIVSIRNSNGRIDKLAVTQGDIASATWLGRPDIIFECSGRDRNFCQGKKLLINNTKHVLVSAVSKYADSILIYGFNHFKFNPSNDLVISFGSCTVIPGVLMISFLNSLYTIQNCTINIIHSVPKWQLEIGMHKSLKRKDCSLESVVPKLLSSIKPNEIKVNYTYAPFYGVSVMDFHFKVNKAVERQAFIRLLKNEINYGKFKDLIALDNYDVGADTYLNSPFSIVIIKSSIDIRNKNIYFYGYFNNEGSGIRLHELATYILSVLYN